MSHTASARSSSASWKNLKLYNTSILHHLVYFLILLWDKDPVSSSLFYLGKTLFPSSFLHCPFPPSGTGRADLRALPDSSASGPLHSLGWLSCSPLSQVSHTAAAAVWYGSSPPLRSQLTVLVLLLSIYVVSSSVSMKIAERTGTAQNLQLKQRNWQFTRSGLPISGSGSYPTFRYSLISLMPRFLQQFHTSTAGFTSMYLAFCYCYICFPGYFWIWCRERQLTF